MGAVGRTLTAMPADGLLAVRRAPIQKYTDKVSVQAVGRTLTAMMGDGLLAVRRAPIQKYTDKVSVQAVGRTLTAMPVDGLRRKMSLGIPKSSLEADSTPELTL